MSAVVDRHRRVCRCLRCDRFRQIHGRGLCRSCFVGESARHNLDAWPRRTHILADVAEDFVILHQRGSGLSAIAAQLGYADEPALAAALFACYRAGHLTKTQLPRGMWRARDRRRDTAGLEPREVALLRYCATTRSPEPCAAFNLHPATLRTYKFRIRRKLVDGGPWEDAVKAFVAEAVLAA